MRFRDQDVRDQRRDRDLRDDRDERDVRAMREREPWERGQRDRDMHGPRGGRGDPRDQRDLRDDRDRPPRPDSRDSRASRDSRNSRDSGREDGGGPHFPGQIAFDVYDKDKKRFFRDGRREVSCGLPSNGSSSAIGSAYLLAAEGLRSALYSSNQMSATPYQ